MIKNLLFIYICALNPQKFYMQWLCYSGTHSLTTYVELLTGASTVLYGYTLKFTCLYACWKSYHYSSYSSQAVALNSIAFSLLYLTYELKCVFFFWKMFPTVTVRLRGWYVETGGNLLTWVPNGLWPYLLWSFGRLLTCHNKSRKDCISWANCLQINYIKWQSRTDLYGLAALGLFAMWK